MTLADGRRIILDSVGVGNLVNEKGITVIKLRNGQIAYNSAPGANLPEYHTISVPRGGRPYQLELVDGSKIWLNAESSLRYPDFFTGNSRTVELTGEGYFEVAKNTAMPFHVKYNSMDVRVLGTHFNVNTYEDEKDVRVTLLEGSVNVNGILIKPGEQSILDRNSNSVTVSPANTDLAIAWVHGYFQFDKTDLKTILRQVGRWYDLDVEYSGNVPPDLFSGKIERNLPLTGIVKLLDQGNIKVKVEGKKMLVQ